MQHSVRYPALALAFVTACGLPRDPERTLSRVRGGWLRVGYVVDTPWVTAGHGGAGGIEGDIVAAIARDVDARVVWTAGSETPLLTALQDGDLDLVAAGLTKQSPWAGKVSLTRPYYVDTTTVHGKRAELPHVLAIRAGENAWQVRVEQLLEARRQEIAALRHAVSR
jgi:polar amino acid transport system substrate-binding protein